MPRSTDEINLDNILLDQGEDGDSDHGHLRMLDRLREGRGMRLPFQVVVCTEPREVWVISGGP